MFRIIRDWFANFSRKFSASPFVIKGRVRRPLPTPATNPVNSVVVSPYVMNDLSTPNFIKNVNLPLESKNPAFFVNNYAGGGFAVGTPQQTAANVYITVSNVIGMINHHSEIKMNNWARTRRLNVYPFAGNQFNAFYNGAALKFFSGVDPKTGRVIHTADSAEIVSHETGHAVLDFFKPDLWNKVSLEFFAFHEGFADLIAMLTVLQNDEIVKEVISSTGGNLRVSNIVSKLAEDLGIATFNSQPSPLKLPYCLREAINDFQYQAPETLPKSVNSYNELCSEPHNFGRVMLGTFYDMLEMFYKCQLEKGLSKEDSLKLARNILTAYALKAVQNTPTTPRFFEAFCKTILWVDSISGKIYTDKLRDIFQSRHILPVVTMLEVANFKDVKNSEPILSKTINNNNETCLIQGKNKTVKFSSSFSALSGESLSDYLYDIEVDLSIQSLYILDKDENIINSVECSESDAMKHAYEALLFLDKNNLISDDPFTPFEIRNGKLIRTNFSSCIVKTPSDPEWGKLYKPENNKGCCGGCCKQTTPSSSQKLPNPVVSRSIKSCAIRYTYKTNKC